MKKMLCVVLSVVICFLFCACNERGTDIEEIEKNGKIVVGVMDNKPLTYMENGEWTGFDVEMARLFAEELGVEAEFVKVEMAQKYEKLKNFEIDCLWSGVTIDEYYQEDFSVGNPYLYNSQVLIMKADVVKKYENGYDTRDLTFAVRENSASQNSTKRENCDVKFYTETQEEALALVAEGKVDAAIVDSNMADIFVGEGNKYDNLAKGFSYSSECLGVVFRNSSDLLKKFNEFLAENKEDEIWKLSQKYDLTIA